MYNRTRLATATATALIAAIIAPAAAAQAAPGPLSARDQPASVAIATTPQATYGVRSAAEHCTVFCTVVYNGTNRNLWMAGNTGSTLVRSGHWSNEYYGSGGGRMLDVDNVAVPTGCTLWFRLRKYVGPATIRVQGLSPRVWIYGRC